MKGAMLFANHPLGCAVVVAAFAGVACSGTSGAGRTGDVGQKAATSSSALTASSPAPLQNGVMMQGFYWNVPSSTVDGSWWRHIAAHAPTLAAAGIDAVWIPPPHKGQSGGFDVGYAVYDRYDLGEFNQKGTVATRYGTLAELQGAIGALHNQGIGVYADIVMNQMMGADGNENVTANGAQESVPTHFAFPGRGTTYSSFVWNAARFNGCKLGDSADAWVQWQAWDFAPYLNGQAYDNLLGCEVRYADQATRDELIAWGQWLTTKLSLDGYRVDAVKHMLPSFVNAWFDTVKGSRFAVSEAWLGDVNELVTYTDMLGGRTSLFDVPLHYVFVNMSNGNGAWDMRGLKFAGLTEQRGNLSVPFVDNHDTDASGGALTSPIVNLKMLAYAYILTRDKGYPCVFWRDFDEYGLGSAIGQLVQIRKKYAFGGSFEHDESDADVYVYSRLGDAAHPGSGLLLLLNDGAARTKTVKTFFPNQTLHDRTGNSSAAVTTGADGTGNFPVPARSYGVWTP
jgi:alpha-amylase